MTFDRSDYAKFVRRQAADRSIENVERLLQLSQQVALSAAALSAGPEWAWYQQTLQGAVAQAESNRARTLERLAFAPAAEIPGLQRMVGELDGMIMAWRAAIELPVNMRQNAEAAQSSLLRSIESIEKRAENAG